MNIHTVSGKNLSKLGIGSFGIGGRGHRNVDWEKDGNGDAILTLVADFEKHIGVSEWNEA